MFIDLEIILIHILYSTYCKTYEQGHEKMCLMSYANNKGADQPVHPHSLISAFVVRCLDSIISLDSRTEISRLASLCGCAGRFVSGLVGNSRRHIFSWRGSYSFVKWLSAHCTFSTTEVHRVWWRANTALRTCQNSKILTQLNCHWRIKGEMVSFLRGTCFTLYTYIVRKHFHGIVIYEPRQEKICLCHMRATMVQIRLWLLNPKFHESS